MAAAVATTAAVQPPVSAQLVGHAFVQQYYHILYTSPGLVYRFYQDISKLGRPEEDGTMSVTTTMHAINEKIVSLNPSESRAEIKNVRSQESFNGGVQVLVTGILIGRENIARNFAQTFFLAPQDKGYFVLNDIFDYVDAGNLLPPPVANVVVPIAAEPVLPTPPPAAPPAAQVNQVSEESSPSAEEAITGEVYNPSENGDVPIVEEEAPVAEVVDEIQNDSQTTAESNAKVEDTPKKSYASIVMDLKEKAASFTPPVAAPRKVQPKYVEPVSSTAAAANEPVPTSEFGGNATNQEGEAEGYSIYIKGLPMTANNAMVEEVFKHFGIIKSDGIQVRSNRGFCFGFVEYEEASSVEKALEASPVMIGGRETVVEEKRSTYSRGNNRGRFQNGRGPGYRSEGGRGRGNYGGGRGFNNRGDFNGRSEFVNRGGNRGGASNREGYQRSENFNGTNGGGRMNRNGGMANGSVKSITQRVPVTA